MQTELYIEDQLVDLSGSVNFPVTKQFEDMQDPTTIINEFSKTVKLPFSNNNDRLFGLIFNPSRAVITDGTPHPNAGIWFDPTKKMKARLVYDGNILLQGYAKMTGIKRTQNGGNYEINLFGELGSFFADVKGITWKDMTDDLSGNSFTIDRSIVNTSWTTQPDLTTDAVEDAATTDIIGFACCNQGLNEDFDSKSLQDTNGISELKDRLETAIGTSYNIEGLIGEGLTPRQMCDFRSYYQQPYIYLPRFFEIVKRSIEAKTDYKLQLHQDWFSDVNPYYRNLVMLLSRLQNDGESKKEESTPFGFYNQTSDASDGPASGTLFNDTIDIEPEGTTTIRLVMPIEFYAQAAKASNKVVNMTIYNALKLNVTITGANSTVLTDTIWVDSGYAGHSGSVYHIDNDVVDMSDGGYSTVIGYERPVTRAILGNSATVDLSFEWADMSGETFVVKIAGLTYRRDANSWIRGTGCTMTIINTIGAWRSGYTATLNDLWKTDDTPWDVVIKYCKQYGLLVRYDILTKTCTIMPRGTYFSAGQIEDWSRLVDMSKDFVISPSSFDTKYIGFNPEDDTDKGEKYKEQVGVGFGGVKVNTGYDFNTSMKDIVTGKAPVFSSENVLPWSRMITANFTYRNSEPMVYAESEGKPADMFGTMYFYNGLATFDTTTGTPYLTDDTPEQLAQNKMTYIDGSDITSYATAVSTYPNLDVRRKKFGRWTTFLCTYGVPAINYDATKTFGALDHGTYDKFWKEYIGERYGVNTKIVQCYLWITPAMFATFDMNTLIRIDNRVYLLNKIIDYDCTKTQPTKCELVSVYNLEAYTDNPVAILYEWDGGTVLSHVNEDEWSGTAQRTATFTRGTWNFNIAELPKSE